MGTGGLFHGYFWIPDMTLPVMPDQMSPSSSQRNLRRSSADPSDSGGFSGMDSGLTLASDSTRYPSGGASGASGGTGAGSGQSMGMGTGTGGGGGMPSGGTDNPDGLLRRGNIDDLSAA